MDDLETRVRRLENFVHAPVIGGPNKVVKGSTFELINELGAVVATLKPAPSGDGAGLAILDSKQEKVALLSVGKEGPQLMLTRKDGKGSVVLGVDRSGHAQLALTRDGTQPVILLSAAEVGGGVATL